MKLRASRSLRRQLLLVGITVAALLPFSGRAFHVDDTLFLRAAEQIRKHPFDPYGFDVNWYGTPMKMADVTKNPPLVCYYIAAVDSVFGRSERALHLAFLLPAVVAILGTYKLAGRLGADPMVAALATLFTPVFLVSASGVMSDVFLLALWVVSAYLWITGLERGSAVRLVVAAVGVGLAALAKYFGAALIPVLLAYTWVKQRRVGAASAYFLLPAGILGAYQWATHALYGRGLLFEAASYASRWSGGWERLVVGLAFVGGCLGVPAALLLRRERRPARAAVVTAGAALVITAVVAALGGVGSGDPILYRLDEIARSGGAPWACASLLGIFAALGAVLLIRAVRDVAAERSADALLIGLWVVGTYVFAVLINWSVNGRTILPLVPAAAVMLARRSASEHDSAMAPTRTSVGWLAAAACIALAVAAADAAHADSARQAARQVHQQFGTERGRVWFQGHWGFQYYMESFGFRPVDVSAPPPPPGDVIVMPENNVNLYGLAEDRARQIEVFEVPSSIGVAVLRLGLGAGFYSDFCGPLPWVLTPVPPERYRVFQVIEPQSRREQP